MSDEKNIVVFSPRTGRHVYGPGEIWSVCSEHDGSDWGPFLNMEGEAVSIPSALVKILIAGNLRRWKDSEAQARKNMEYHLDELKAAYHRGFDPTGEVTVYALDHYRWASDRKWKMANEICDLARKRAGLSPLLE